MRKIYKETRTVYIMSEFISKWWNGLLSELDLDIEVQ